MRKALTMPFAAAGMPVSGTAGPARVDCALPLHPGSKAENLPVSGIAAMGTCKWTIWQGSEEVRIVRAPSVCMLSQL